MTAPPPVAVTIARARWRSAEDRLYPALLADPDSYQRGLAAVQAVVGELRVRIDDVADLLAVEADADNLLAVACPSGMPVPADLLVAVACGMRDREITAAERGRIRDEAVARARAAGSVWAVLDGPADIGELTEGRRVTVHLDSGTLVEAIIDPWARAEPFGLSVQPGEPRMFADRDAWLAAVARVEADVDTAAGAED